MPEILHHHLRFKSYCFSGPDFPGCDFADPVAAQKFFGSYQLRVTYYDSRFEKVIRAGAPGRYGAVIDIHHEGKISRRFQTLCCLTADGIASFSEANIIKAGIPVEILAARRGHMVQIVTDKYIFAPPLEAQQAAWTAALFDLAALERQDLPLPGDSFEELDKQWWIELKRRFYRYDRVFARPFLLPQKFDGPPAPTAQPGTLAQAGMKPDAHQRIDAAAKKWLATNDIGFATCVARRGILAISDAWGSISQGPSKGQPFTPDTSAPLASTTKFLGAILMLQFVDQGFVDFDTPISKYFPQLKDLPHPNPPRIRDFYRHTAGFTGHWGDTFHDTEEVLADIYATLRADAPHQYHGVGHALGGKLMEAISGLTVGRIYRRCLLEPLICTHSYMDKTSYGTNSSASDLVRIGQLTLNGGRFGNLQFFTPRTLQAMQPIPGHDRFEPDKKIRWGVGIKIPDGDGLSERAFGGSGATGSFLFIDPARDLVIAHTRFEEGPDFPEYLRQRAAFIQAVKDCLL